MTCPRCGWPCTTPKIVFEQWEEYADKDGYIVHRKLLAKYIPEVKKAAEPSPGPERFT